MNFKIKQGKGVIFELTKVLHSVYTAWNSLDELKRMLLKDLRWLQQPIKNS